MITRKQKQCSTQSSQSGFTIVESLMAIVVVTILMTAIAPVIVLSVASRVQSRRVEQASQAARAYIDGLRTGAIEAPITKIAPDKSQYLFKEVAAPTSGAPSLANLYCIDLDDLDNDGISLGDTTNGCTVGSSKDLAIQAFRSVTATSVDPNDGYLLGLRVYRAYAFNDNVPLTANNTSQNNNGNKVTQATFTAGVGASKAPLVEMTTEIFVTDKTTYRDYCKRLPGGC